MGPLHEMNPPPNGGRDTPNYLGLDRIIFLAGTEYKSISEKSSFEFGPRK
jgi:hypothetical protein